MDKAVGNLALARQSDLVIQEVDSEVLVYDLKRHKAHCLNRSAAAVWRRCDGATSVKEMALALGQEFGGSVDEDVVWFALEKLSAASLLGDKVAVPEEGRVSRRSVVRKLGVAGLLAVPAVMSLVSPTLAQGASVVNTTLITTVARCNGGTTQCLGSCCSTGPAANAMVCIAATPNPNCAGNPCVTQLPTLCVGA